MWVKWTDGSIYTSAHIVRDDTLSYIIGWEKYMVVKRDIWSDRAILSQRVVSGWYTEDIWHLWPIFVWDSIYTEVIRDKKIAKLAGKVVDPSGSVVWYDAMWRTMTLSWIVLTDLALLPWDSGAPIFSSDRELIDVVHVK